LRKFGENTSFLRLSGGEEISHGGTEGTGEKAGLHPVKARDGFIHACQRWKAFDELELREEYRDALRDRREHHRRTQPLAVVLDLKETGNADGVNEFDLGTVEDESRAVGVGESVDNFIPHHADRLVDELKGQAHDERCAGEAGEGGLDGRHEEGYVGKLVSGFGWNRKTADLESMARHPDL